MSVYFILIYVILHFNKKFEYNSRLYGNWKYNDTKNIQWELKNLNKDEKMYDLKLLKFKVRYSLTLGNRCVTGPWRWPSQTDVQCHCGCCTPMAMSAEYRQNFAVFIGNDDFFSGTKTSKQTIKFHLRAKSISWLAHTCYVEERKLSSIEIRKITVIGDKCWRQKADRDILARRWCNVNFMSSILLIIITVNKKYHLSVTEPKKLLQVISRFKRRKRDYKPCSGAPPMS